MLDLFVYPEWDEFYLVVCDHCNQILRPHALDEHISNKHLSSLLAPSTSNSTSNPASTSTGNSNSKTKVTAANNSNNKLVNTTTPIVKSSGGGQNATTKSATQNNNRSIKVNNHVRQINSSSATVSGASNSQNNAIQKFVPANVGIQGGPLLMTAPTNNVTNVNLNHGEKSRQGGGTKRQLNGQANLTVRPMKISKQVSYNSGTTNSSNSLNANQNVKNIHVHTTKICNSTPPTPQTSVNSSTIQAQINSGPNNLNNSQTINTIVQSTVPPLRPVQTVVMPPLQQIQGDKNLDVNLLHHNQQHQACIPNNISHVSQPVQIQVQNSPIQVPVFIQGQGPGQQTQLFNSTHVHQQSAVIGSPCYANNDQLVMQNQLLLQTQPQQQQMLLYQQQQQELNGQIKFQTNQSRSHTIDPNPSSSSNSNSNSNSLNSNSSNSSSDSVTNEKHQNWGGIGFLPFHPRPAALCSFNQYKRAMYSMPVKTNRRWQNTYDALTDAFLPKDSNQQQ